MQIRKKYKEIGPELLYDEIKDFILKQGTTLGEAKLKTYSIPTDSSSSISRGTLTFMVANDSSRGKKECVRVHIVGSAKDETKVLFDIDENLFSKEKVSALKEDLDFIFGSYEIKHR